MSSTGSSAPTTTRRSSSRGPTLSTPGRRSLVSPRSPTRIRLGTLVSPATFRHPSVLARMAVTVDHISGGRVEVGLGSGWYEREHIENGFPFLDSKAALRPLRRAGRGRRPLVDGGRLRPRRRRLPLRGQTALPKPVQRPHPPLILGGGAKPRFAALAARYANEVNTLGAASDELRSARSGSTARAWRRAATRRRCVLPDAAASSVPIGARSSNASPRLRGRATARSRRVARGAQRPLARRHGRGSRRAPRRSPRDRRDRCLPSAPDHEDLEMVALRRRAAAR